MEDYKKLNHTKWQCKYQIVFIPKYRRRTLYGHIRNRLVETFHALELIPKPAIGIRTYPHGIGSIEA